jgi:FG-GAP repeat protein/Big-like domain-containing protein
VRNIGLKTLNFRLSFRRICGWAISLFLLSTLSAGGQVGGMGAALDTTAPSPPDVTIETDITSEREILISGTAEAGSQVAIWGGREVVFINLGSEETSFERMVGLNRNRVNVLKITATDLSGNESDEVELSVEQDDKPPDPPILATSIRATNRRVLELNGTTDAGARLIVEGGRSDLDIQLDSGISEFSLQVPLKTNEPNNLSIYATDRAGNRSEPATLQVAYDDRPPPPPSLDDFSRFMRRRVIEIRGETEPGSLLQIISDQTTVIGDNPAQLAFERSRFTFRLKLAENVRNDITIAVTDAAGNVGEPARIYIIHDNLPPEKPVVAPLPPFTPRALLRINGQAKAGDYLTIAGGGEDITQKLSQDAFEFAIPLRTNGPNYFEIYTKDEAGNIGPVERRSVIHDDIPPPPPQLDPQPPVATSDRILLLTGKSEKGSQLVATGGAEPISILLDPQLDTFNVDLKLNENNLNEIEIFATDRAGNRSTPLAYRIVHDDVAPLPIRFIDLPTISNQREVKLKGLSEAGALIIIEEDDRTFKFKLSQQGPGFSFNLPLKPNRSNNVTAWAIDEAGNESKKISFSILQDEDSPPPPEVISLAPYVRERTVRLRGFAERGAHLMGSGPSGKISLDVPQDTINFEFNHRLKRNKKNTFILQAVDAAGNISPQATFITIHDDIKPPRPKLEKVPRLTNRSRVVLKGTVERNNKIRVVGGLKSETTQMGPEETAFTLGVYLKRNQKNSLTVTSSVSLMQDDIAPFRPKIIDPPSLTTRSIIRLNGEAEYGSQMRITGGGETVQFKVTKRGGRFSIRVPMLMNVENELAITATDAAGNVSLPTRLSVLHDNIAPLPPVFDVYTEHINRPSLLLNGRGERGATLEIVGGQEKIILGVPERRDEFAVEVVLRPNRYNRLQATLVDPAGNRSSVVKMSIEHDDIAPKPPALNRIPDFVISPQFDLGGRTERGAKLLITGGADNVTRQLDANQATFKIPIPLNKNVINDIRVYAIDAAGNRSAPSRFSLVHDDTPPPPPHLTLPADDARHYSLRPSFYWTIPEETNEFHFQLSYDRSFSRNLVDTKLRVSGYKFSSPLQAGSYYWHVRSRDDKGNWSNFSHTRRVILGHADGDVNGDGYSDIIVGDPTVKIGKEAPGKAFIYYGGADPDNLMDMEFVGNTPADRFGMQVANIGDFNNDGYDDIAIAAPDDSTRAKRAGRVYVYLGGPVFDNIPDLIFEGERTDDHFGSAIAAAGDVNDDGYDDFLIQISIRGEAPVALFLGGAEPDTMADVVMRSNHTEFEDFFRITGSKIVSGGIDFNGDGFSDFIIRTLSSYKGQLVYRGMVYYGSETPDSGFDFALRGPEGQGNFASEISAAGDLNADGFGDVVMGVSFEPNDANFAGKALVFFGGDDPDEEPAIVLSSKHIGFGQTVACAGDINNDDYNDLIVGIGRAFPSSATSEIVWIYLGGEEMSSKPAQVFKADPGDSTLHSTVSPAGRFNGDNNADFVVGLPYGDQEFTYVYQYDSVNNYFDPLQISSNSYTLFSMFGISIAGPSRCF